METLSMFEYTDFDGEHVLITRTKKVKIRNEWVDKVVYRARWSVESEEEASAKVAELNRDIKKAELAEHRYNVEVGGLKVNGLSVHTDRETQAALANAYASLKEGFFEYTPWKGVDGWVEVSLEHIAPIAQVVSTHVRQCFVSEKTVSDQLDAIVNHEEMANFDVVSAFNQLYNPRSEDNEGSEVE